MVTYENILTFIIPIINSFIFVIMLQFFKKDNEKHLNIITLSILSCFLLGLTILNIPYYGKIFIEILILSLTSYFYNIKLKHRFILIILYYYLLVSINLFIMVLPFIFYAATALIQEYLFSKSLYMTINYTSFDHSFLSLYLALISKAVIILLLILIKKKFKNKNFIIPPGINYTFIGILMVSTLSIILLIYTNIKLISSNINIQFNILFLICLCIILITIGTLFLYFSSGKFYTELKKETAKKIYNKSYEKYIHKSKLQNKLMSEIWHDINSHLRVLERIATSNNEYINSLKDKLHSIPNTISTGNPLADVILNDKCSEANIQNINFDVKAILPPSLPINDMDFSSILFNTIDNAIEASLNFNGDNKYISIKVYTEANFLIYKIKNSYLNTSNGKKRFFNKKKYISKGYGINIVKDIASKYNGDMKINQTENEFMVTILLCIK